MPLVLTEVDAYTADVTVPEGGDARTAASVEAAFQALANRSKYLKARVDNFNYVAPVSVTRPLNVLAFRSVQHDTTPYYDHWLTYHANGATPILQCGDSGSYCYLPLEDLVPDGATIATMVAHVVDASVGDGGLALSLRRKALTLGAAWETVTSGNSSSASTALQALTIAPGHVVDKDAYAYAAFLRAASCGDGPDQFWGGLITLTVPGLRP